AGESLTRRRNRDDIVSQGIADPTRFPCVLAAQCAGKAEQNAIGAESKDAVGEPGNRVCVVNRQRLVAGDAHERAGERRETSEAENDVRRAPPYDLQALPEREQQREGADEETLHALAAYARKADGFEVDAVLRHQTRFHAFARAEPENLPSFADETRRNGESGKNVSSGPACGDHHRAGRRHTVNPRSSLRFWLRPATCAALMRAARALASTEIFASTRVQLSSHAICRVIP